jgi:hypothetical protein
MDTFKAVMIVEGVEETETEDQILEAWQHLIDTGLVWQMQGTYGRTAAQLIDRGLVTAP